jgi:hypothetical protein
MADGKPKQMCGKWFVSVHGGSSTSTMMNALNEYFGYSVTLTMRITEPLDRFGSVILASQLARTLAKETGFNAKAEQLRAFLHMNWGILQDANTNLVNFLPGGNTVYGFSEPAHYAGREEASFQLPDWFGAPPPETQAEFEKNIGLKSELKFEGARRLQAIASFV